MNGAECDAEGARISNSSTAPTQAGCLDADPIQNERHDNPRQPEFYQLRQQPHGSAGDAGTTYPGNCVCQTE